MTKTEALELLRSGTELTPEQRERISDVLSKAEVYNDAEWNESETYWESSY